MNYPDNYSAAAHERRFATAEEVLPQAAANVHRAQAAYRECLAACAGILAARGFAGMHQEPGLFEALHESLHEKVSRSLDDLAEHGFDLRIDGKGE